MIAITILIELVVLVLSIVFFVMADDMSSEIGCVLCGIMAVVLAISLFIMPFAIGELHGYINYNESNDKDLARITAVTQEQTVFRTYYKVEVEYLTNTPTQEGVVVNKNIEKDTFYCYFTDKELVKKMKENQYKELWIITGYKGGYESFKDFGSKLIKDIELKEEQ